MKEFKSTPTPSLARLPKYLQILSEFKKNGLNIISSNLIAKELNSDPVQVRKDIASTGIIGKPKTGYNIDELIQSIEKHLNWNNTSDAVLVGAGNLGKAFLGYSNFRKYGLNICAAFDTDESKVGQVIKGIKILPMNNFVDYVYRMHIQIGIITVPSDNAQKVAELMILAGIRAIWNFAPVQLKLPESIHVEDSHLSTDIANLKRRLKEINTKK